VTPDSVPEIARDHLSRAKAGPEAVNVTLQTQSSCSSKQADDVFVSRDDGETCRMGTAIDVGVGDAGRECAVGIGFAAARWVG
jgi:hypothetical protein